MGALGRLFGGAPTGFGRGFPGTGGADVGFFFSSVEDDLGDLGSSGACCFFNADAEPIGDEVAGDGEAGPEAEEDEEEEEEEEADGAEKEDVLDAEEGEETAESSEEDADEGDEESKASLATSERFSDDSGAGFWAGAFSAALAAAGLWLGGCCCCCCWTFLAV